MDAKNARSRKINMADVIRNSATLVRMVPQVGLTWGDGDEAPPANSEPHSPMSHMHVRQISGPPNASLYGCCQ